MKDGLSQVRPFFDCGELAILQGFLRKAGGTLWFFDGQVVVDCW
jgi:hypothetical protein